MQVAAVAETSSYCGRRSTRTNPHTWLGGRQLEGGRGRLGPTSKVPALFFRESWSDSAIDVCDALKSGGVLSSLVLTTVERSGSWRVELAWPNHTKRYFGSFSSQAEAEKWIKEHRRLTERPQELHDGQGETANGK
jgi:hypothetical protein